MLVRLNRKVVLLLPLLIISLFIAACSDSPTQSVSRGATPSSTSSVASSPPFCVPLSPTPTIFVTPIVCVPLSPTPRVAVSSTSTPSTSNATIRVTLEPVPDMGAPSAAQMDAASSTLSERLAAFGFTNASISQVTLDNLPALQVTVPHFNSNETSSLEALLKTGELEFWSTGAAPVQLNTDFEPTQYLAYNPSGQPWFTGNDVDGSMVSVSSDQTGRSQVNFEMKGSAIERFATFTANNVGQYLTITLDRNVIESAVIQSAITGPAVISGNFTPDQAKVLASILKYPALPVTLQIASEETF